MAKALSEIKVKDIMTTKIWAALPEDDVLTVAKIMLERDFSGLPVVDQKHKLLGVITMKELLDKNGLYLPTAVKLLKSLHLIHAEDLPEVDNKLKALKKLKAGQVMNREPLALKPGANLEEAAEAFLLRQEDLFPVVDDSRTLVGVITKYDVLKMLTNPLEPIPKRPLLTEETEMPEILKQVESKFVAISRTRIRFWYLALFVFLVLGILIAIAAIIRVTTT